MVPWDDPLARPNPGEVAEAYLLGHTISRPRATD